MAQRPAIGFRGWIATAGLAGAMLLAGAAAPPMTVLFSPGFRVRVEADSAPAGQVYSTWADPFLQRLYRLLQWEVRPFADRTLTLRLEAAREGQAGDLTAEQPVPGQVEQVLWIYGADGRQRPALEELLTEAALERRVMDRMTPAALQKGIPAVPRWLSVGLARYLDADLRARDARWVGDSVEAGIWPAVSEWVTWRHLPEAYAEEKSFSGQAVAWILSRPAGAAGVQGLLDALAMGRPIDAGQVAARLNFTSIAEAESDWRDWLERQGRVVRFGMEAPRERVRRLTAQLTFTEEELTRAGVPSRLDLTWSALPAHRGQPWLIRLVRRKAADLRLLSIGKEQRFDGRGGRLPRRLRREPVLAAGLGPAPPLWRLGGEIGGL